MSQLKSQERSSFKKHLEDFVPLYNANDVSTWICTWRNSSWLHCVFRKPFNFFSGRILLYCKIWSLDEQKKLMLPAACVCWALSSIFNNLISPLLQWSRFRRIGRPLVGGWWKMPEVRLMRGWRTRGYAPIKIIILYLSDWRYMVFMAGRHRRFRTHQTLQSPLALLIRSVHSHQFGSCTLSPLFPIGLHGLNDRDTSC